MKILHIFIVKTPKRGYNPPIFIGVFSKFTRKLPWHCCISPIRPPQNKWKIIYSKNRIFQTIKLIKHKFMEFFSEAKINFCGFPILFSFDIVCRVFLSFSLECLIEFHLLWVEFCWGVLNLFHFYIENYFYVDRFEFPGSAFQLIFLSRKTMINVNLLGRNFGIKTSF